MSSPPDLCPSSPKTSRDTVKTLKNTAVWVSRPNLAKTPHSMADRASPPAQAADSGPARQMAAPTATPPTAPAAMPRRPESHRRKKPPSTWPRFQNHTSTPQAPTKVTKSRINRLASRISPGSFRFMKSSAARRAWILK